MAASVQLQLKRSLIISVGTPDAWRHGERVMPGVNQSVLLQSLHFSIIKYGNRIKYMDLLTVW